MMPMTELMQSFWFWPAVAAALLLVVIVVASVAASSSRRHRRHRMHCEPYEPFMQDIVGTPESAAAAGGDGVSAPVASVVVDAAARPITTAAAGGVLAVASNGVAVKTASVAATWKSVVDIVPYLKANYIVDIGILVPNMNTDYGSTVGERSKIGVMRALKYHDEKRSQYALFGLTEAGVLLPVSRMEAHYREEPFQFEEVLYQGVSLKLVMPFFSNAGGEHIPPRQGSAGGGAAPVI